MPPKIVNRPDGGEESPRTPRGVKPQSAGAGDGATSRPSAPRTQRASSRAASGSMSDAELEAKLIDGYKTLGTIQAGAGYMRRNQGLALAGLNVIVRAEDSARIDMAACKQNPQLRAMLVKFLKASVMGEFIGNKVMLLAPTLAAFVPHPIATTAANQSIDPRAHLAALENMPDLFVPVDAPGAGAGVNGSTPAPDINNTDGQA